MHLSLLASEGVELHGLEAGGAEQSPTMVSAVRLSTLAEQLKRLSEVELLTLLASKESGLLETVEASRCVLVSYRQEAGPPPFDSLTLDGQALHGIVLAASQLGADAVWLDAWCYRMAGTYVHDDFCRTLDGILSGVSGVVWLPRSTSTSLGEYGYRLWCTFEASNVYQRRLRVAIAGVGLSRFQQRVCVWGSFIPALRADSTLDQLARLNLSVYFFAVAQLSFSVVAWAAGFVSATDFVVHVGLTAWCLPLWLAARQSLGQQVRLAKNAKTVLGIMCGAARRRAVAQAPRDRSGLGVAPTSSGLAAIATHANRFSSASLPQPRAREHLLRELAWLPAYDRRDVLVVHNLLACLPGGAPLSVNGIRALALSAYTAARMRSSAGDNTAVSLSLRAWLKERNVAGVLGALKGGESARATWLDGVGDAAGHDEDCLPLPELVRLSWTFPRGAALTPLGALALGAPDATKWALAPAQRIGRPQLLLGTIGFLASNGLEDVVSSLLMILQRSSVISSTTNEVVDAVMYFVQWPFLAILIWERMCDIASSILARRIPLPSVVANGVPDNIAIEAVSMLQICATFFLFWEAKGNWQGRDSSRGGMRASALQDLSEMVVYFVLVLIFFLEAFLLATVVVRGTSSARDVAV